MNDAFVLKDIQRPCERSANYICKKLARWENTCGSTIHIFPPSSARESFPGDGEE